MPNNQTTLIMGTKKYAIWRYYENGNVKHCATFDTLEKAVRVMNKWKEEKPYADYNIHEE